MWELNLEKEDEPRYQVQKLLVDKLLTVGRKGTDIILINDDSISRKHANIQISHPISNVNNVKLKPVCLLKDGKSKYGTFINGNQISGEGVIIKHGDLITFGQCGSNFRASYKPLVVTTSCLDPDQKINLQEIIRQLGGHIVKDWTHECTHLVMSTIKLTVKVVCALLSEKHIVTPDYFKHYVENCSTDTKLEDPEDFLPPVNEAFLNDDSISLKINRDRSQLFKDKTFIFLSAHQYVKLCMPVTLGGGKGILMNRSRCEVTSDMLLAGCVIEYKAEAVTGSARSQSQVCSIDDIDKIRDLLRKHKRRFIPESDIGLAVVYSSTEHYCNPDFEFDTRAHSTSSVGDSMKLHSQSLSQNYVFVPETRSTIPPSNDNSFRSNRTTTVLETQTQASYKTTVVPETLTQPSLNGRNKPTDSRVIEESMSSTCTQSKKRSASPDLLVRPAEKSSRLQITTSDVVGSFFEAETQAAASVSFIKLSAPSSSSNTSSKKRSSNEPEKDIPKRSRLVEATLDIPNESLPMDIKNEPVSPLDVGNKDLELNFDVDTQPSSEVLFKQETQPNDVNHSPKKRKDNSNNHEQQNVQETFTKRRPTDKSEPVPTGFSNSTKPNKMSKETKENTMNEEELLVKVVNIEFADLVIKQKKTTVQKSTRAGDPSVKNFKKFRKTINAGLNHLPTIIGGNDLIVYMKKEVPDDVNDWLQGNDTENTQPDPASNTSFNAPIRRRVK